jgi:SP family general alpha glucoside:H+ symporter-like MFS transporter
MVAMIAAIFIPFFSNSLGMLVAGEVLCGLPWGVFQTLTTAYAAEVCPIQLRGYLASCESGMVLGVMDATNVD